MTYQELWTRARSLLYETQGTPGAEDPFTFLDLAVQVTNEIARRTNAIYLEATTDITTSTALYCIPSSMYKLRSVQYLKDTGDWAELPVFTTPQMNRLRGARWQSAVASDPAAAIVIDSPTFGGALYPLPSTARTAALKFGGLWMPSYAWGFDTAGNVLAVTAANGIPNMTASNPLPLWAQDAVPWGMAYQRTIQFPTVENAARRPFLQEQYERRVGEIHGAITTFNPPAKFGVYAVGPVFGF